MAAHAKFGPSAMKRIIACPGSVLLCEQAPPAPPSPYAEEGTRAHALAEALLLQEETLPEHDEETRAAVQVYVDYCDPLIDEATKYGIEATLHHSEDLFGTADCYALVKRTLYVVDYKHGQGVTVSAARNPQGLTYAGLVFADSKTGITPDMVDNIVITIVQPRGQGEPVDEYISSPEEVAGHMAKVELAMQEAMSIKPRIQMGDHCRFCRAKLICPALKKAEQGVAEWDSRDLDEDELSEMLVMAKVIEQKIKDLYAYALVRLEQGEELPGWKLVPKRATRKWVDEEKVFRWAKKYGRIKEMYKRQLLSPAQAAKVLGDEYESLTHLVESVSTGTNMAPEDDPREAVKSPFAKLAALGKRAI